MEVRLDHTIVRSSDRFEGARFLTGLLGLPEPKEYGPFAVVPMDNGVSIDYATSDQLFVQHLAFLVDDDGFDEVFARIQERDLPYWGAPGHREPQQINHRHQGRGVYVDDPDGHAIEFLTHTYTETP